VKGTKVHDCGMFVYKCFPPAVEGEKCGHVIHGLQILFILDITLHQLSDGTPKPKMADR
jgi:hypothetical protein